MEKLKNGFILKDDYCHLRFGLTPCNDMVIAGSDKEGDKEPPVLLFLNKEGVRELIDELLVWVKTMEVKHADKEGVCK